MTTQHHGNLRGTPPPTLLRVYINHCFPLFQAENLGPAISGGILGGIGGVPLGSYD